MTFFVASLFNQKFKIDPFVIGSNFSPCASLRLIIKEAAHTFGAGLA
jgi:hypothetical protein